MKTCFKVKNVTLNITNIICTIHYIVTRAHAWLLIIIIQFYMNIYCIKFRLI